MDGQRVTKPKDSRRRHTDAFKQTLIERSLVPGASVAAIAQEAGINANLLFNWRRLYVRSMASASDNLESRGAVLLPVTVAEPAATTPTATSTSAPTALSARSPIGTIEINIRGTVVRLRGTVDEASLRTVLRALASAA